MTSTSRQLGYLILKEVFDDIVAAVADKLFQWNGQTLQQLFLPPKVPKTSEALTVLIHHNLVTFQECSRSGRVIYNISEDRVLSLLKFPRYLILCKTLFGDEGELIVEELFKLGQASLSTIMFKSAKRLYLAKKSSGDSITETMGDILKGLKTKFVELTDCQFLCRIPTPYTKDQPNPAIVALPNLENVEEDLFKVPDMNFKAVKEALEKLDEDPDHELQLSGGDKVEENETKILWRLNFERFQREFRDQIIVLSVTRRIDALAGSLMRILLNIMNDR